MVDGIEGKPRDYFAAGEWPAGRKKTSAPRECVYAAVFANHLQFEALELAREAREAREAAEKPTANGKRPGRASRARPQRFDEAGRRVESLAEGVRLLSSRLGIPASTLRAVIDGMHWPNLAMVARVELVARGSVVSHGIVVDRLLEGTPSKPAGPVEKRGPRKRRAGGRTPRQRTPARTTDRIPVADSVMEPRTATG